MKPYLISVAAALMTLSACGVVEEVAGPISAAAARSVVGPIVQEQVPGPIGVALTDCIIENASQSELVLISAANAGAPSAEIVLLVSDILARDTTVACATSSITS